MHLDENLSFPLKLRRLAKSELDQRVKRMAQVLDIEQQPDEVTRRWRGVMIEPPLGVPDADAVLAALGRLGTDLFAIVEQDLYPCDPDVPLPIATRTREYFNAAGLGPRPRSGPQGTQGTQRKGHWK